MEVMLIVIGLFSTLNVSDIFYLIFYEAQSFTFKYCQDTHDLFSFVFIHIFFDFGPFCFKIALISPVIILSRQSPRELNPPVFKNMAKRSDILCKCICYICLHTNILLFTSKPASGRKFDKMSFFEMRVKYPCSFYFLVN